MSKINIMKFDDDDEVENIPSDNDMLVNNDDNNNNNNPQPRYRLSNEIQISQNYNQSIQNENIKRRQNKQQPTMPKQPVKRKKKKATKNKFFISFLITILFCILSVGGVFFAYDLILGPTDSNIETYNNDNSKYTPTSNIKDQYNFAFFGVDNESDVNPRTDFMMIGSYNTKTNKVQLMSVPRDTLVYMPQDRINDLKANDVDTSLFPSSGKMKLNEVNHFATDAYGTSYLLAQLEELFEVDFDFYVKFDLEGFKYLVDAIGGVPFYVPQRMYYNDPTQDLYVDLQEGYQVLNGEQAEGVVRYRHADLQNPISEGYAMGDLDRIQVQQDFIVAFIEQLSSLSNLSKTLPGILQTAQKYCETNFKLTDLPNFLPFLTEFSTDNIEMYTMPYDFDDSYIVPKQPETDELIDQMFYSSEVVEPISSVGLDIEVLNATYTSGLATKTAEELEANGLTVSYVGDYNGDKQDITKIYVKSRAYGSDLKPYFNSCKIVANPDLTCDIQIVVGLSEVE